MSTAAAESPKAYNSLFDAITTPTLSSFLTLNITPHVEPTPKDSLPVHIVKDIPFKATSALIMPIAAVEGVARGTIGALGCFFGKVTASYKPVSDVCFHFGENTLVGSIVSINISYIHLKLLLFRW